MMLLVSMTRKAIKDFQFSDGTFIPAGTLVSPAAASIHHDDKYYENANAFNPWRFADLREEEGEGFKHQMVSTSVDFIPFGHGRHAWYAFVPFGLTRHFEYVAYTFGSN